MSDGCGCESAAVGASVGGDSHLCQPALCVCAKRHHDRLRDECDDNLLRKRVDGGATGVAPSYDGVSICLDEDVARKGFSNAERARARLVFLKPFRAFIRMAGPCVGTKSRRASRAKAGFRKPVPPRCWSYGRPPTPFLARAKFGSGLTRSGSILPTSWVDSVSVRIYLACRLFPASRCPGWVDEVGADVSATWRS